MRVLSKVKVAVLALGLIGGLAVGQEMKALQRLAINADDGDEAVKASEVGKASVSIKYYDRTMYYPGQSSTNPILVHITISNQGPGTMHFKLADDKMFSLDFNVFTAKNAKVAQTKMLEKRRTTNQRIYFREITLESGEEYAFIENVKDFVDISEPAMYYLELKFYPELFKARENELTSNRLNLEVRPSPDAASGTRIPLSGDDESILQQEEISPDKVVEQTIQARQRSLWDKFFLYMDLEQMYRANNTQSRQYSQGSYNDRQRMLDQYRADLMQERIDRDIVAIPRKFEVEKTSYTAVEGTVSVIEWFPYDTYTEKKRYTYYVRQRDGIWLIYAYSVDNLGTE